jgi:hypothetical protein
MLTISQTIGVFFDSFESKDYLYKAYLLDNGDTKELNNNLDSKKLNSICLYLKNGNILDFEYDGCEWCFLPSDVENGIKQNGMSDLTLFIALLNSLYSEGN